MKNYYLSKILIISIVLTGLKSNAQFYTEWNGVGNWSNGSNWSSNYTYAQLEFKGLGETTSNNDLNPASQWRLFFQGSKFYTLTGNLVNLTDFSGNESWILSESSADQNINLDIGFIDSGARPSWITTRNTGDLIFNGNINVGGSVTYLSFANTVVDGRIIVNGILSGTKTIYIGRDESFNSQSTTSVEFTGANSYDADTFIDGGSLRTSGFGTLGIDADVFIAFGSTLFVDNNLSIASISERGLSNGGSIEISAGANLIFNGNNKGVIFQNSINGPGNLIIETTGTTEHNLYGNNGLTGTTTIREGTMKLSGNLSGSDVIIENGGTLLIEGAGQITVKSLNIEAGGTVQINGSQSLKVLNDVINMGTINLSSNVGGDLIMEGNFDDNGIFNANGRAVFFQGSNPQAISSTTNPLEIDVIRISKTGGEVIMNQNLLADETQDPIQFTTVQSVLNLNGKTLTIGKTGVTSKITMADGSTIKGSSTSGIAILGNGPVGELIFDVNSAELNNLTINRNTAGSVTLGTSLTTVSTDITSGQLIVPEGLALTPGELSLQSNGKLILNSTSELYSSLIPTSVTDNIDNNGTIIYNRFTNVIGIGTSGGNDLVAAPLSGQSITDFVTANSNLAQNGDNTQVAFGIFNNTTGSYENYAPNSSATLSAGTGYRAATTGGGTLAYTGAIATGPITTSIAAAASVWNLIGNPYPSYISSTAFLSAANTNLLDPEATAIYGYNDGTYTGTGNTVGNFTIINNNSNSDLNIAPGQGFFVASNVTGGDITFTPAMRTTVGSDDFILGRSSAPNYYLLLELHGNAIYNTSFYFNENSTS